MKKLITVAFITAFTVLACSTFQRLANPQSDDTETPEPQPEMSTDTPVPPTESAQDLPVVNVLLFNSDSCSHCTYVNEEVLPGLIDEFADQLLIIQVNIGYQDGKELFQSVIEYFDLTDGSYGVPFMVVGDTYLMGSAQIPEQLPGLIEDGLDSGGIDWPEIPGLEVVIGEIQ